MRCVYPILLLTLLFVCGCGRKTTKLSLANPDAIHQRYSVLYNGRTTQISAFLATDVKLKSGSLELLDSGKPLELDGKGSLSFNGKPLEQIELPVIGLFYSLTFDGPPPPECKFSFTDAKGKVYHNTFTTNPISMSKEETLQHQHGNFKVKFAPEVGPNESVKVTLHDATKAGGVNFNKKIFFNTAIKGIDSVQFTSAQLDGFGKGEVSVEIMRRTLRSCDQSSPAGGLFEAQYLSYYPNFPFSKYWSAQ